MEGTLQDTYGSQYAAKETFDPRALSANSEAPSRERAAPGPTWDQLSPEMQTMAKDLIGVAESDPGSRWVGYSLLERKRYRDQEVLKCVSVVGPALPADDLKRRAGLYCGAGFWLGGNINTRSQGEELLRHVIQLIPSWGLPHTLLGILIMGDSRNAFLEIGSTNRSIHPELSDTELEVQARSTHEQALEQLKEAIRFSPYDASNYFAFTASKFLDYQVIKSRYQRGLQLDYTHAPEFASNHWDFAMLASQQGFHQDAQDAFLRERLVRLDMDGNRSSTHQPSVQQR